MPTPKLRTICKRLVLLLAVLAILPLLIIAKLEAWLSDAEAWFNGIGKLLSLVPGRTGNYLRLAFYRNTLQECSPDVVIDFGALIVHRGTEIGQHTAIGAYSIIGTATLGHHVLVASRVSILSGRHQHIMSNTDATIAKGTFERVRVGANSWIGEGAIVAADIGERCVLAAGSVLFRRLPDGKMAMGNPARPLPAIRPSSTQKVPTT
jgi:acetyltransferase-like isoleucine patch superfamily enzyme